MQVDVFLSHLFDIEYHYGGNADVELKLFAPDNS